MPPQIIALYSARPQMGKSTALSFFKTHGYEPLSFAADLRVACASILMNSGCPMDRAVTILSADKDKPCRQLGGKTGRDMLIEIGQAMRLISPTWWIDSALSKTKPGGKYVIDDLRFPNEFDGLRARNATLVRIVGDRGLTGVSGEGQLDDMEFNYTIANWQTTSLDTYHEKLEMILPHSSTR